MKAALAALFLLVAGPAQAAFNPVEFFRGRTQGEGTLKVVLKAAKTIRVDNVGTTEKDGSLLLTQRIHEPGKAARTRYWRLRETGPSRFEGTLTDATGPVRVEVHGERVRIRYRGKDHLDFEQWLTPAGATRVNNEMRVRRFGIVVARFSEVIRKLD